MERFTTEKSAGFWGSGSWVYKFLNFNTNFDEFQVFKDSEAIRNNYEILYV